jgi:hypothetical protein
MEGYEYAHKECNSREMAKRILSIYEKIVK